MNTFILIFNKIYIALSARRWSAAKLCALISQGKYYFPEHEEIVRTAGQEIASMPEHLIYISKNVFPATGDEAVSELLLDIKYEDYRRMKDRLASPFQ